MDRQEGYYWVKPEGISFIIAYWDDEKLCWFLCGTENTFQDSDFEHINEVRIKFPGELPD